MEKKMYMYYRRNTLNKKQKGVIWSDTRRIRMALTAKGGGGGGGGAGGHGGNGGCVALVTSNLTPTTNNPLGVFIASHTAGGTKTIRTQKFTNMVVPGGIGGGTGPAGAGGGGGAVAGGTGPAGGVGYEGLAFVQFV